MRSEKSRKNPRRWGLTGFEALETRQMLSSGPLTAHTPGGHPPAADVAQFVPVLYPPGTPQPTAAEIQRQSFVSKSIGRYAIGPPRFNTQSITIHGYGKPSSSNVSLKSHFQYILFEPSNPSNPVYGEFNILAGNTLQSGAFLILDVKGPTGSEVNGLPTHLFWTPDISSGVVFAASGFTFPASGNFPGSYVNSQGQPASPPPGSPGGGPASSVNNWNMGFGDITFTYIPDRHPQPGTLGSGRVIVVARGLLNTSGAQNPIDPNYN
ncbi:MAG TPA: hypothetical protein VJY33_10040 [Isosphaeraceae bacterium]|nr:hypothetical protein [Isosphaeraceae bacterium]